jgi:hypothetical protein
VELWESTDQGEHHLGMKPPNFHFYKPFSVFTHLSLSLPIYLLIYLYLYLSIYLYMHTHTHFSASKGGLSIIIFRFTFHPMLSHPMPPCSV